MAASSRSRGGPHGLLAPLLSLPHGDPTAMEESSASQEESSAGGKWNAVSHHQVQMTLMGKGQKCQLSAADRKFGCEQASGATSHQEDIVAEKDGPAAAAAAAAAGASEQKRPAPALNAGVCACLQVDTALQHVAGILMEKTAPEFRYSL